jgi:Conjugal transfer protein
MRRLIITLAVLAVFILPAWAQKIEIQKPDRNQIVRVQTALNHLTVIEVGETVTTVAAGSPAFKIEWRENKVFVQPSEPGVTTNLFIWTASGRLNYELEAAGAVEQMDFAIDHPIAQPSPVSVSAAEHPASATSEQFVLNSLLGGRPIRTDGLKEPKNRVIVLLKDTYQRENHEVFIRYAVRNDTRDVYTLTTPKVFILGVDSHPSDLDRLVNFQVGESATAEIESDEKPVDIVSGSVRSARVEPGQETVGVIGVKLPAGNTGPTVIRLVFPEDGKGQPTATLVL